MIEVEAVDLNLLQIGSISDFLKGEWLIDNNAFNAAHIEISSFFERFSDKFGYVPLSEDLEDLIGSVVLCFFLALLRRALFGDFLPEFAHGELAGSDFFEKRRGDCAHESSYRLKLLILQITTCI